jgi:hypothetical protein
MGTVLPLKVVLATETEIDLVDERGGLESVTIALATEMMVSESAKFGVNDRDEFVEGFGITGAPLYQ